jgi:hypothetical protein
MHHFPILCLLAMIHCASIKWRRCQVFASWKFLRAIPISVTHFFAVVLSPFSLPFQPPVQSYKVKDSFTHQRPTLRPSKNILHILIIAHIALFQLLRLQWFHFLQFSRSELFEEMLDFFVGFLGTPLFSNQRWEWLRSWCKIVLRTRILHFLQRSCLQSQVP